MMIPSLRKLIDDINKRYQRRVVFQYKDGKKAVLSTTESALTVTTDNKELMIVLGKLMEKILSGQFKPIDKDV